MPGKLHVPGGVDSDGESPLQGELFPVNVAWVTFYGVTIIFVGGSADAGLFSTLVCSSTPHPSSASDAGVDEKEKVITQASKQTNKQTNKQSRHGLAGLIAIRCDAIVARVRISAVFALLCPL